MSERVGKRLRQTVVERAHHSCEYCGMPDNVLSLPHEPDHVIATQHGGQTTSDNLAYTCFRCNRYKGPNLSSIDPQFGVITPLFNPRRDEWRIHFRWSDAKIVPLTDTGRATVALLRFNDPERVALRQSLISQGRCPFAGR